MAKGKVQFFGGQKSHDTGSWITSVCKVIDGAKSAQSRASIMSWCL